MGEFSFVVTFVTRIVVTVVARYVIPAVPVFHPHSHPQSMHTVLVVEVVWLIDSPEGETGMIITCPAESPLHASVVKSYPGFLSRVAMLDVHILFLVMNRH